MIIFLFILSYVLIGLGVGRRTFIKELGTAERKRYDRYNNLDGWTNEYQNAIWWSVFMPIFWIVFLPIRTIFSETPHEANLRKKEELRTLEREIKRLEYDYDLTFHNK